MMTEPLWPPAPPALELTDQDVHVWRVELEQPDSLLSVLRPLLSEDEQSRANRFYFERDRRGYIVARGVLRLLLGRYLEQSPAALRFVYNAYGKPALAAVTEKPLLHFNLSHSGSLALYAIARHRILGVDVERIRPEMDLEGMAKQVFSPLEQQLWRSLPGDQRVAAFFNGWTRKEAFVKAQGLGLSLPLDQFAITLQPGVPVRLLHTDFDPSAIHRWALCELPIDEGYKAALAVEGFGWQLHGWRWENRLGADFPEFLS